jgi:hypothetical protein
VILHSKSIHFKENGFVSSLSIHPNNIFMNKNTLIVILLCAFILSSASTPITQGGKTDDFTCTGTITSVTLNASCVDGGSSYEVCVSWAGSIPALELANKYGFTGGNPADVGGGYHCFTITVNQGHSNNIFFNLRGAGGSCYGVDFGGYCFANCSGAECS